MLVTIEPFGIAGSRKLSCIRSANRTNAHQYLLGRGPLGRDTESGFLVEILVARKAAHDWAWPAVLFAETLDDKGRSELNRCGPRKVNEPGENDLSEL
ncbi:hypothetical protein [Bradyrhizobium sp. USDA 4486]